MIIGAGFGGLAAAKRLAGRSVDVTIIDQRNYHTFQPLLYEVATAGLDPADVGYPVRAIFGRIPNVRFRLGTVTRIEWGERLVCFAGINHRHDSKSDSCADDIPFDSLIVASGAVVNFFGVPGVEEHALPLYTLADARTVRDHILLRLEEADGVSAHFSDGTLNFVVVGGGPTGVEVSGAIAELLDMSFARDGLRFDRSLARIVLVDGLDHVLTAFRDSAQEYAETVLRRRTIETRLGVKMAGITPTEVELEDGSVIPTRTVIWAGGVTAHGTIASELGGETTRSGQLVVDSYLAVPGYKGLFAVGDAAAIPTEPGSDQACPQLAQAAIQSGRHAANQILAQTRGKAMKTFRYRDKGTMATIGRRAAIAQLRDGLVLRGTAGWLAWFGLHLVYLVGFRNRLLVFVNWTWRYLNWPSGPRIIIESRLDTVDGERPHPAEWRGGSGHRNDWYRQEAGKIRSEAKGADGPRRVITTQPARSVLLASQPSGPEGETHA
ncbi:MAG: NAD(P)/FAD-dependent oxidoreductase [Acidimicrobiales bacterium]